VASMSKKHDATVDADEHDGYRTEQTAKGRETSRVSSPVRKKKRDMTKSTFWREMFSWGIHRRQQGRIVRQATFGALFATIGVGCWRMSQYLSAQGTAWQIGIPLALFAVGAWVAYRLVNYPPFADFLIHVEAEMIKVSWPTRTELFRSSVVVMVTIFGLAFVLWAYDIIWHELLKFLRVVK
jgi:preprotein translocase subunit SecE